MAVMLLEICRCKNLNHLHHATFRWIARIKTRFNELDLLMKGILYFIYLFEGTLKITQLMLI